MSDQFNHSELCSEGGEIHTLVTALKETCERNGVSFVMVTHVANTDQGASMDLTGGIRENSDFPPPMQAIAELMHANPMAIEIVRAIIELDKAAKANADQVIEQIKSDLLKEQLLNGAEKS
jgi:hypothetical protein